MPKPITVLDGFCAVVGIVFSFLFGELTGLFLVLLAFMALDYITGIIVAIIHKNLSSEIGFKGMAKKLLILVFYAIGHMIDTFVFADMAIVTSAVTFFYLANEGVSIVENAVKLGLPVPQKIRDVLAQLKSKSED